MMGEVSFGLSGIEALCESSIRAYRQRFSLSHPDHPWNSLDDSTFLWHLGTLCDEEERALRISSTTGLLMFGKSDGIISVFPHYYLEFTEHRSNGAGVKWTDRITTNMTEWSGNVFDFLRKITPRLFSDLKIPFRFNGNQRCDYTPIHKAVRDMLMIVLANADFNGQGGILINKNFNSFSFSIPCLMSSSIIQAEATAMHEFRNHEMAELLRFMETEEWYGIPRIFEIWRKVYQTEPSIKFTEDGVERTTITFDAGDNKPDIDAMRQLY